MPTTDHVQNVEWSQRLYRTIVVATNSPTKSMHGDQQ
jgi:hypothetical protein